MVKLVELPPNIKLYGLERRIRKIKKDYTGFTKNGQTIIGYAGIRHNNSFWLCRCKCGNFRLVPTGYITRTMHGCKSCDKKDRNWGGLVTIVKIREIPDAKNYRRA